MKRFVLALFFVLSILGCQKDPSRTDTDLMASNVSAVPQLVQASDGTLYSKSCLQENATQIKAQGASAMSSCKMKVNFNAATFSGETERTRFFYNSSYAWIYYPPTYWNYNNGSSSNNSSNNNGSNTNYSNNYFCSFVFGPGFSMNCYALFGYTDTNYNNYNNYYNPSCNTCLYSSNPSYCKNRCYQYGYFYVY